MTATHWKTIQFWDRKSSASAPIFIKNQYFIIKLENNVRLAVSLKARFWQFEHMWSVSPCAQLHNFGGSNCREQHSFSEQELVWSWSESSTQHLVSCRVFAAISGITPLQMEWERLCRLLCMNHSILKKNSRIQNHRSNKTPFLANQTKWQNTLKPENRICAYFYECNEPQVLNNTQRGNRSSHLHSAAVIFKGFFFFFNELQIIADSAAASKFFSHLYWHSL